MAGAKFHIPISPSPQGDPAELPIPIFAEVIYAFLMRPPDPRNPRSDMDI